MLIIFKNKLKKYHTSVDDKIIFKLIFQVFCIGYLIQTLLLHIDNNISKLDCNLTLQKKTNVTDKLIDYSMEFDYAFDTINNIR